MFGRTALIVAFNNELARTEGNRGSRITLAEGLVAERIIIASQRDSGWHNPKFTETSTNPEGPQNPRSKR